MFTDVVISAPYGSNGGVIYVYLGSVGGIIEPASQVEKFCIAIT